MFLICWACQRGRRGRSMMLLGLTWPLATFCAEAGVPYFFHRAQHLRDSLQPASAEPVFLLARPWRQHGRPGIGEFARLWAGWDQLGKGDEEAICRIVHEAEARHWPYDALLSQDGTDFTLVSLDDATKIHDWNAKYAYPHLGLRDDGHVLRRHRKAGQAGQIRTFAKDGNKRVDWTRTRLMRGFLGWHRRQDEGRPHSGASSPTIASAVAGGGYPWESIYQAYHRLLTYHEHSDGIYTIGPDPGLMQEYETEQEEDREMVVEAEGLRMGRWKKALTKASAQVTTTAERSVHRSSNPLPHARTDVVRSLPGSLGRVQAGGQCIGGRGAPGHCRMGDSIVATDVPATGYRCFSVLPAPALRRPPQTQRSRCWRTASTVLSSMRPRGQSPAFATALGRETRGSGGAHRVQRVLNQRYEKHPRRGRHPTASNPRSLPRDRAGGMRDDREVGAEGVKKLTQTVHPITATLSESTFAMDMEKSPRAETVGTQHQLDNREASVCGGLPFAGRSSGSITSSVAG